MTIATTTAAPVQLDGGAPLALDFCCKAGGASAGMVLAGFRVIGVDIEPQPAYPYEFVKADVVKYGAELIERYRPAVVIGSPPCKTHTALKHAARATAARWDHVDIIADVRAIFRASGLPYVIENVEQAAAHMVNPMTPCGTEFGLSTLDAEGERRWLKRHRLFESNIMLMRNGGCADCSGRPGRRPIGGVHGGGGGKPRNPIGKDGRKRGGYQFHAAAARDVLGVPWMNRDECAQAIPPAYTKHIGEQLMRYITT
jgi:DNA (cytosine-5)-methyltransferase 1